MKMTRNPSVLALLLVAIPSVGSADMEIQVVSRERAKQLGMAIHLTAEGRDALRVKLEFETKGPLERYRNVDLEVRHGQKTLVSSALREDRPSPVRVVVGFVAARDHLEELVLRVVVDDVPLGGTGYELRMKDFLDRKQAHSGPSRAGEAAPPIMALHSSGDGVSFPAKLKGKVVLVTFWELDANGKDGMPLAPLHVQRTKSDRVLRRGLPPKKDAKNPGGKHSRSGEWPGEIC